MPFTDQKKQKREQARWYQRNKKRLLEKQRVKRAEFRKWLDGIKCGLKCERCPESEPICLDFHHRDPKQKLFEISEAVVKNTSIPKTLEEIKKCMVLCANCHRKQHQAEALV